jgi:two-component system, sensor histidine kinase LadS
MLSKVFIYWLLCLVWLAAVPAAAQPLANALAQADAVPRMVSIGARSGVPSATTREAVEAMGDAAFKPFEPDAIYPTDPDHALWLKLQISADTLVPSNAWRFDFQQNYLDRIELHNTDAQGQWRLQTTGDQVASVDWPIAGLYPRLLFPALTSGEHTLWLKVEHQVPTQLKMQLLTFDQSQKRMYMSLLITGALVGLTLLMLVLSLYVGVIHRDAITAWYAVFALCSFAIMVNSMGLGAYLIWPQAGKLLEWSVLVLVLTIAAVAAQMQFCRRLFLTVHPSRILSNWSLGILMFVVLCLVAFISLTVYERGISTHPYWGSISNANLRVAIFLLSLAVGVFGIFLMVLRSAFLGLKTAFIWILAYLPLCTVTAIAMAGHFGFAPIDWLPYYAPMYCLGFEVPMLLIVLQLHHKGLYAQQIESSTLARLDPHTGFLSADAFKPELARLWMQAKRSGKDIAVVYVKVLQGSSRDAVQANQAVVRIMRTVAIKKDCVAHVQGNVFAIVMPKTSIGETLSARLARMVALGMMAGTNGLDEHALRFQIVCGTLRASTESCVELHRLLLDKLALTKGWEKRSIRYVIWRARDTAPDSQQISQIWSDALEKSEKPVQA